MLNAAIKSPKPSLLTVSVLSEFISSLQPSLLPKGAACFDLLQFLQATFDPDTGLLSSFSNLETKQTIKLTQNFYWLVQRKSICGSDVDTCCNLSPVSSSSRYNASSGNNVNSNQPSGAYIFRPNSSTTFVVSKAAKTETVQVA